MELHMPKIEVMRRRRAGSFYYGWAIMVLLIAGSTGCAKTGSSFTTSAITYVSVMNMAPYAPTADIYLNGSLASQTGGIPPGNFSTKYGSLQPGNYDVLFKKSGSDSLLAEIPASLYDTSKFYTVLLYNNIGGGPAQAVKMEDDFTNLSPTNANYRFFNLAPDAPKVDFYLNGAVAHLGRSAADNIYNTSYNSFQQVAPATCNLQVKAAGTDSVVASVDGVNLQGGGVYTIFLSETKNGGNSFKVNVLQASF